MNFISKNWQKDAPKTLIKTGMRVVGGIGGAFVANKIASNDTMKNLSGPVLLGLGTLGSMMLEQPELKALCEGMATYGGMKAIARLSPDTLAPRIGISGLEEDESAMFGLGAGDSEEYIYVDENGNEVNPDGTPINGAEELSEEEDAAMFGLGDNDEEAAMFGLGSNENSTADTLPEFADGGTPANDGNPWSQVADQIDVDGGVQQTTNGIGDAEAAMMF